MMAEALADVAIVPVTEDVDFSLGETLPVAANIATDDFELDLGAGEVKVATVVEEHQEQYQPTAEMHAEISEEIDEIDEIGYEEEGEGADDVGTVPALNQLATAQDNSTTDSVDGAEDIDYAQLTEEADRDDDAHTGRGEEQAQAEEAHNGIDFGFEDAGDDAEHAENSDDGIAYEEHSLGEHDHEEHDHEEASQHHDDVQEDEIDDAAGEEDDGDISIIHVEEIVQDDSDDSGQDYDEDAENAGDNHYGESPYGSLNSGIGRLQSFDPASNVDVVVSWGDDVCPLFKTPDVEDPDSFYLEDRDALDYPLSQFLQAIRNKISTYIAASDEIYIRVESLGLEFGETTTEALMSQVTFHNLLALHTTLVKNEDEDSSEIQGVRITLGTRPNCLLRLKDLVSGAGQGMGLSDLQTRQSSRDDSSEGSFEAEVEFEVDIEHSSPDDDETGHVQDEGEDEDEDEDENEDENDDDDEEGADVDMAGDDSGDSENAHQDAEPSVQGADADSLNADDDEIEDGVNEVEFAAYDNNGEEEEHNGSTEEAVGGLLFAAESTVPGLPAVQADDVVEEAPFGDGSDLLADIADDANDLEHHDELDLLEDINEAGDLTGEAEENFQQEAADESATVNEDDDFLDLSGDIGDGALVADTLNLGDVNNAFGEEAGASLGTSATATLDHDEIDYEDNDNNQGGVSLDVGDADEIDWDDELKNAGPLEDESLATVTPTTASGKRSREVDESANGAVLDDQPDFKRRRADDASL
ncbi:glutamic acid-rich protein [Ophiostoma piceae UAMH 11346]|uniref:Glutamic acid-rich protein n=1 Tax=Ophiostoma piceae (strain UAMH 11346) TaxID=1262450 RepID=S3CTD5_OPHP1|nr:glutamic acid-rich protein [Ophiostoma piceae UAMH 11346]